MITYINVETNKNLEEVKTIWNEKIKDRRQKIRDTTDETVHDY